MAALLVVDDNPSVLSVTTSILEAAGHFIISAIGGALGIAAFELHQARIHAVLMDVVMPEVDGVMAFGRIRQRRPDVPFVFVTGTAELLPPAVLAEPRVALLTKPFHVADLVATVDQVLATVTEPDAAWAGSAGAEATSASPLAPRPATDRSSSDRRRW